VLASDILGSSRADSTGSRLSLQWTPSGETGTRQEMVGAQYIYRELLRRVIAMFETGEPPLDVRETLEIIAFIEAALQSAQTGRRADLVAV